MKVFVFDNINYGWLSLYADGYFEAEKLKSEIDFTLFTFNQKHTNIINEMLQGNVTMQQSENYNRIKADDHGLLFIPNLLKREGRAAK
jgi:hypothetical protein